jgi:AraC-like DNA-binding protein
LHLTSYLSLKKNEKRHNILNALLLTWDAPLRGAVSALFLFHLCYLAKSALSFSIRASLVAFVATVMAYPICSHPGYESFSTWIRWVALGLCLMSTPSLWLAAQVIFNDSFRVTFTVAVALFAVLPIGVLAFLGIGGAALALTHKGALIIFALATLWNVFKNWRSDLVSPRRRLRYWVGGGLGTYVLFVVSIEFVYVGANAPEFLTTLHIAGISLVAGALALVMANRPPQHWLQNKVREPIKEKMLVADLSLSLTAAPQTFDRTAQLRVRLLREMREKRIYAKEGLTVAALAQRVDATPTQLREIINQHLGYRNFNDFLHHYRVDEAAQRLLVQDLPILSIALDVGYGSIGPFNRAFKEIKGVTPSDFRSNTNRI